MYTDNYTNLYGFITITRYTQLLCTMLSTMYGIRISYMYRDRQSDIHYQMHVLFYSLVTVTWMPEICGKKRTQFCVHMYIGDALGCILTVKPSMISLTRYHSTDNSIQCTYRIAGNFRWCKFSRKSVQTLQKKFSRFLFSRMRDALATPLPVDGHASYAKRH